MTRLSRKPLQFHVWEVRARVTLGGRLLDLNFAYLAEGGGVTAYYCGNCSQPLFALNRARVGRGGRSTVLKCANCDLIVEPKKGQRQEVQYADSVRDSFFRMYPLAQEELRRARSRATGKRIRTHVRRKLAKEAKYQ